MRPVASSLPTTDVGREAIVAALDALEAVKTDGAPKSSTIVPRYTQAVNALVTLREEVSRVHPRDVDGAVDLVVQHLPKFVYYSTYGNLDSEIYLPHVIANMSRKDLGAREQAKARTLKVLFDFVRLQPQEIHELGRDFKEPNRQPTEDEIAAIADKKRQRSILLQSASSQLTQKFRDW